MRATNHKHYGDEKVTTSANSQKARKGVKAISFGIAVAVAAVALIIPTSTLAPDVDAYEDSRFASLSVGDIDQFSSIIAKNCVQVATVPVTEALTAVEEKTEAPSEKTESENAEDKKKSETNTENDQKSEKTEQTEAEKTEAVTEETSQTEAETEAETEETTEEEEDSASAGSYYTGALMSIDNPDPNYSPSYVSLSDYDRAKLERLVMGEAGTMGYYGCALVAQSIRDAMNRSGTSSIDYIISQYQYFGSTYIEPNEDVKSAVSYIFDQNGSAVQHRVICFYIGYSSWHETQTFITEIGGVRFFDLNA